MATECVFIDSWKGQYTPIAYNVMVELDLMQCGHARQIWMIFFKFQVHVDVTFFLARMASQNISQNRRILRKTNTLNDDFSQITNQYNKDIYV